MGELINASRKAIMDAIETQGSNTISAIARDQKAHGANYIDVNAGLNPLDKQMTACINAAEMLLGRDAYCVKHLKAYRAKKIEV